MPTKEEIFAATAVIARFDMRNATTIEKNKELAKLVLEAAEKVRECSTRND